MHRLNSQSKKIRFTSFFSGNRLNVTRREDTFIPPSSSSFHLILLQISMSVFFFPSFLLSLLSSCSGHTGHWSLCDTRECDPLLLPVSLFFCVFCYFSLLFARFLSSYPSQSNLSLLIFHSNSLAILLSLFLLKLCTEKEETGEHISLDEEE